MIRETNEWQLVVKLVYELPIEKRLPMFDAIQTAVRAETVKLRVVRVSAFVAGCFVTSVVIGLLRWTLG